MSRDAPYWTLQAFKYYKLMFTDVYWFWSSRSLMFSILPSTAQNRDALVISACLQMTICWA